MILTGGTIKTISLKTFGQKNGTVGVPPTIRRELAEKHHCKLVDMEATFRAAVVDGQEGYFLTFEPKKK